MGVLFVVLGWMGMVSVTAGYWRNSALLHVIGAVLLGIYAISQRTWPQLASSMSWVYITVSKRSAHKETQT
jgi:hypothetical protein